MSTSSQPASAALASPDPTATETLRTRKTGNYNRSWRRVRGIIRKTVVEHDAFRLRSDRETHTSRLPAPSFDGSRRTYSGGVVRDFGTDTNADRRAAWNAWFPAVLERHILSPRSPAAVRDGRHSSAAWINEAYARGLALAGADARRNDITGSQDIAPPSEIRSRPIHRGIVAEQYQAAYDNLSSVMATTRADVTETFTDLLATTTTASAAGGLVTGTSLSDFANALNERIDKVGQTGTKRVVHSQIVRTVNRAVVARGPELGATQVGVERERDETDASVLWETRDDSRVCSDCRALGDTIQTVDDLLSGRGEWPVKDTHPFCRCRLILTS